MVDNELIQAISSLLDQKLDEKLTPIYDRLDRVEARLDKLEADVAKLEQRVANLESNMESLQGTCIKMSYKIDELEKKVSDTYELALDAWGTGMENRKWLEAPARVLKKG